MRATIADVVYVVARHYRLQPAHLRGHRRTREIAYPRQLAMLIASEMLGASSVAIGQELNRDHTTVLHGIKRARENPFGREREDVIRIKEKLRQLTAPPPDPEFRPTSTHKFKVQEAR